MGLDIVAAFFLFGAVAQLLGAPIKMPKGLYQSLTLFLLVAIGLKGGIALSKYASLSLLGQSAAVIAFGALLPLIAFPILWKIGGLSRVDSASVAAHYGSVSVATFAVALAYLEVNDVPYEPYFALFVALLEVPAIAVGLLLARGAGADFKKLSHEMFLNQGVLLLVGSILIGWLGAGQSAKLMPFFGTLFHGVLALFLLEMGRQAASRIGLILKFGSFIASFAVFMPLIGAALGAALASVMGLSVGGTVLLATLGASASYIAVPAAMANSLPEANQSLSITASLSITFPFNVLVGIPLYLELVSL
ncbi:sodium-dependent bicarbonate transport family permease [Marinobacterium zhoushanense]|uniref:Sodium-dependent bicarbonate transport family permease n=1 Tax=Marinobacterium zhoushanense TaxID=1679163 RepID=A0ABQ1KER0_9GAMM|nr:sodium-dependent bicarbonate transport family permease [Marinobacterium zhoushanense]GGB97852.1 sodium-dependent bicarbonate transport family permease [Marinobacterium zhoushanense]